jgi:short subunit dehydrogenase-like uncharacterized protein
MSAPTHKQLAARHVRRLRTIRRQLLEMSAQWEDLDQFNMTQLEALADQVELVSLDLVIDGPRED